MNEKDAGSVVHVPEAVSVAMRKEREREMEHEKRELCTRL